MQEKVDEFLRLTGLLEAQEARLGVEQGESAVTPVYGPSIAFITLRAGRVVVVLADGQEIEARPSETLNGMQERLTSFPAFVRSHNSYLVNLDQADTITKTGKDEYLLTLFNGAGVPLLQNLPAVMDYFSLPSLEHVVPWNERLAHIIAEDLRDFDRDIRLMPTDEIKRLFSDGTGQLVIKQVIGNIAWQAYNWIQSGRLSPFDGNLRSFWYSHIKPVLGRVLPAVNENHYEQMSGVFAQYVGDYRLFRYADFGFIPDNDASRRLGREHPNVIVFAEKKGHWRTLEKIAAQTGATVISLGGQPSLMTTEYFVSELEKVADLDETFHLISDVDYDPSGQIIAESFRDQLGKMGVKNTTFRHLITPANFTPEEIQFFKYPVKNESPSDRTKVRDWLNPTKSQREKLGREPAGIVNEHGEREPMGLESDAMPKDRLMMLAAAAVKEALSPPVDRQGIGIQIQGFPYPAR